MRTYKEFYNILAEPIPAEVRKEIRDWANQEILHKAKIENAKLIKQLSSFSLVLIKFIRALTENDVWKRLLQDVFNFWDVLFQRMYVQNILDTNILFPFIPKKGNIRERYYRMSIVTFTNDAKIVLKRVIQKKEDHIKLLNYSPTLAREILIQITNTLSLISKLLAIDSDRIIVTRNDILRADHFIRFLFFKGKKIDFELVNKTITFQDIDVFRRMNLIKIEDVSLKEVLPKLVFREINKKDLENNVKDTIKVFSQLLCVRKNKSRVDIEDLQNAWKVIATTLIPSIFAREIPESKQALLFKELNGIEIDQRDRVWFQQLRKWFFDFINDLEGAENVYKYISTINSNYSLITFLAKLYSIKEKMKNCKVLHLKKAINIYTNIFITTEEPY